MKKYKRRPTPKNRKPAEMTELLQIRISRRLANRIALAASVKELSGSEWIRRVLGRSSAQIVRQLTGYQISKERWNL